MLNLKSEILTSYIVLSMFDVFLLPKLYLVVLKYE